MSKALSITASRPYAGFWDARRRHRLWITLIVVAGVILAILLAAYGWDYYILDQAQRPFSSKHADLKPSGTIGLRLGFTGLLLFALIYLYPLRKRWYALGRIGKTTNWLDFHITLGLIAPVVVSFHSSFKIHGFAGMAYWTMIALTGSGLVGRYFYAQIPRSLGAAEMSLKEMQSLSSELLEGLKSQTVLSVSELNHLFQLPDSREVQSMPLLRILIQMARLDLARPWKLWALRRRQIGVGGSILSLGGVLKTGNVELERAISMATRQAALAKRVLFLSKTQRVFHLWHIIHRPFSLSFAVFLIIHVCVVMWLGYF